MKKRLLAIALVLTLALSLLPVAAFATEDSGAAPTEQQEQQQQEQEQQKQEQPEETPEVQPTDEAQPNSGAPDAEKPEEPAVQSDEASIAVQAAHTHCYCGGSVNAGDHTSHEDVTYQAWNGTSGISYTNNTAYVYLTGNATLNSDLIVDGKTLHLCLNGKTLSSNGTKKIKVRNNARLVLCDCQGGGAVKGVTSGWGGGCVYLYKSTLDMFGGTLKGAKVKHGGGVALDDANCKLNLYGGSISGNTATVRGGGVYMLNGGTINLYGGSISNNTASGTGTKGLGGGVFLEAGSGSINLYGGSVSNNTAKGPYGGGIYLNSAGTVTITGGEISGNKLVNPGNGGGICLNKDGARLVMSGGSIKNNSAPVGAGVNFANGGTFTMSGGSITGNTATGDGGGVRLFRNVTFTMSGGEISDNKAGSGGGIQMEDNSSTLNFQGTPIIKNNTVSGKANNVSLPSGKTLNISGAMSSGASIGVTTENTNYPVVFSSAYDTDCSGYFFSDAGKEIIYNSSKQLEISNNNAHPHTDTNNDHKCDVCGKVLSECADANNDHKCDTCDKVLSECADTNKNHKCDTCGKVLSECADTNKDHKCDVCGKVLSECADTNKDHKCDVCGKVLSECADTNKDHKCDICGKTVSHHTGGTANCHAKAVCEVCNAEYGEFDAANHDGGTELRDKKDATYTSTGYTGDTYCKGCKTKLSTGTVIPKLSGGGSTPSRPTKPAAPGKTVKSGKTGDAGVALYAGMAVLSLTGCAWLRRKEK